MSRTTRAGTKLPRVPLPPAQKVHEKKSKERKVKHKKNWVSGSVRDDEDYQCQEDLDRIG